MSRHQASALPSALAKLGGRSCRPNTVAPLLECRGVDVRADHAIDPPHPLATLEIGVLANLGGQIIGMLDRLAIHVANVQCAVGALGQIHRPEPIVGAGQKLALLGRPPGNERRRRPVPADRSEPDCRSDRRKTRRRDTPPAARSERNTITPQAAVNVPACESAVVMFLLIG